MGAVFLLSRFAYLRQVSIAAELVCGSWIISVLVWAVVPVSEANSAFAILDGALAFAFWRMSRRRWFPVPLFFAHATLFLYHLATSVFQIEVWYGIALVINRLFELSLLYIAWVSLYRIRVLSVKPGAIAEPRDLWRGERLPLYPGVTRRISQECQQPRCSAATTMILHA